MDEKLEVEIYLVWGFLNFIKLFICCLILNVTIVFFLLVGLEERHKTR